MKKVLLSAALLLSLFANAQTDVRPVYVYTEASDLTLVGKIHEDTPNPYHRVDTVRFKGFTPMENGQVRMSSGIAVAFKTNSRFISVKTVFETAGNQTNTNGYSSRGYDLYIRKDGKWIYAESGLPNDRKIEAPFNLMTNMDGEMKECLM